MNHNQSHFYKQNKLICRLYFNQVLSKINVHYIPLYKNNEQLY